MKTREIRKLTRLLIDASFPELEGKTPLIGIENSEHAFMQMVQVKIWPWWRLSVIVIDRESFSMPAAALVGCLVHELCHVVAPDEKSERKIDKMVLKRGYGPNLLELKKYHDKHYEAYTKSDGLTRKEVANWLKRNALKYG